jgi:hypothetical protein
MLRLVHPDGGGNTPARRRRHAPSPALSLTADEARHLRTAIRGIARSFGSLTKLAAAIGVPLGTLAKRRHQSAGLALAVARVAKVSLDVMLSGRLLDAGVCPACGGKRGGAA